MMIIVGIIITLTGRGLLSVLHGVFGALFGIEGLTGFTTFNLIIIRRFIVMLVSYVVATGVIGAFNLLTIEEYCRTASDKESCRSQARLGAFVLLGVGVLALVIFLFASRRWIRRQIRRERVAMKVNSSVAEHAQRYSSSFVMLEHQPAHMDHWFQYEDLDLLHEESMYADVKNLRYR